MSSSESASTFWIETLLKHNNENSNVFRLIFDGKFYKNSKTGEWTNLKESSDWPYYGWTITANEEHRGIGAFLLEAALLTCPSETLRYNEYEDKVFRMIV